MLPLNQSFGAGMGPILLDNVTCDQSHLKLLQCVHPQNIGIHDCDRENVAGVICSQLSTTTTAAVTFEHFNIPPNIPYISTSEATPQNTISFSTSLSTCIINSTLFIIASTTSLETRNKVTVA